MSADVLRVEGLDMRFGNVQVLRSVGLRLRAGEIHGLLGQNGSGKSTLIKILAGLHQPAAGRLWLHGHEVHLPLSRGDRVQAGLAFVHQDLGLLPNLTVTENFLSPVWALCPGPTRIRWRTAHEQVAAVLREYGVHLNPRAPVADLPPVDRASVAIVRAAHGLAHRPEDRPTGGVLVLDEPSVFLAGKDAERLYGLMRSVAGRGAAVLFVSHDIDEVLRMTHRVTVLRDGMRIGTRRTSELDVNEIVSMVVGPSAVSQVDGRAAATAREDEDADRAAGLAVRDLVTARLRGINVDAAPGRVVGISGLPGSGAEDVLPAIFGATRDSTGTVRIDGSTVDLAGLDPRTAVGLGFAFIPSDRLGQACVPGLSLVDNNTLLNLHGCRRGPVISRTRARALAVRQIREFGVRIAGPDAPYATMSGGNQQRAVLAKWLDERPRVLMLDQPTQGVDVGARQAIWALLRRERHDRVTLVHSTDQEELLTLCDEVMVLHQGAVTARLDGARLTKHALAEHSIGKGRR